ncbi:hypothetical protein [Moraxella sp.]|uniref:hypothetical protein n=1 Tax=Moraxella sp. TaxID=479 RepID=UPI0026264D05|nr:hypothetical protein [Moraxella sp.]MCP3897069.1 hypothetical protein [Moraxella sp.]
MQKSLALIVFIALLSACSKPHDGEMSHQSASSDVASVDMASVASAEVSGSKAPTVQALIIPPLTAKPPPKASGLIWQTKPLSSRRT